MRFRDGVATGEVTLAPAMRHPSGCPDHSLCKRNILLHFVEHLGIPPERMLAVGDGEVDVCLLRSAGRSFAFEPKSPAVGAAANRILHGSLLGILDHLEP
jgi:phosphoserine phosphatase